VTSASAAAAAAAATRWTTVGRQTCGGLQGQQCGVVDVAVGARVGIRCVGGPACDGLGDGPERLCRLGCCSGQCAGGVRQEGTSGRRVGRGGRQTASRRRRRRRTAAYRVLYSVLVQLLLLLSLLVMV